MVRIPHCPPAALLAGVLLLSGARAQGRLVHPPDFAGRIGQTSTYNLFRSYPTQAECQSRYLQIHDLKPAVPLRIRGMALRFATFSDVDAYYRYQPFSADLELCLSTSPVPAAAMVETFASSIGLDAVEVIARKTVNFPAKLAPSPTLPAPFAYGLPFDAGKSFLLPAGGSLCWEQRVHDTSLYWSGNTHLLLDTGYLTTASANAYYGQGSQVPSGNPRYAHYGHLYDGFSQSALTHTIYGTAHYGPPFGVSFMLLALARAPLPGVPLAPGASLLLDPGALVALLGPYPLDFKGATFSTSSASPFAAVAHLPGMEGAHLHGQWVSFGPALEGPYTTGGILLQLPLWTSTTGPAFGLSRCYRTGNTAFTDVSGTLNRDIGVIVEFAY